MVVGLEVRHRVGLSILGLLRVRTVEGKEKERNLYNLFPRSVQGRKREAGLMSHST